MSCDVLGSSWEIARVSVHSAFAPSGVNPGHAAVVGPYYAGTASVSAESSAAAC